METAVITTKGQVTIPLKVREEMGFKTGDRIEFVCNPVTGKVELERKTGSIEDLRGLVKYDGPPISVEEMNRAIGDHLAQDDERIKREWRERS